MSSTHFDQQLFGRLTHYKIFNTLSDNEFHVFWSKTIWLTDTWPIATILKHHLAMSSTHFDQQLFGYLTLYKILLIHSLTVSSMCFGQKQFDQLTFGKLPEI